MMIVEVQVPTAYVFLLEKVAKELEELLADEA